MKLKLKKHFCCVLSLQEVKVKVLEQVQDQIRDILDKALIEIAVPFNPNQPRANGKTIKPSSR